jgi:hypothetical protein
MPQKLSPIYFGSPGRLVLNRFKFISPMGEVPFDTLLNFFFEIVQLFNDSSVHAVLDRFS